MARLGSPVAVILQILDGALPDPGNRAIRQQVVRPWRRRLARIERIAAQRNEIGEQLLAQQRAAALLAQERAALFARAGVERTPAEPAASRAASGAA